MKTFLLLQAIWYTKDRAEGGFVFGNADKWNGLAVIFDSFDNDGQVMRVLQYIFISHTLWGSFQY